MTSIDVDELLRCVEPTEATVEQIVALRDQLVQSDDLCRRLFESEEPRATVTVLLARIDEDCESVALQAERFRLTRVRLRRRRVNLWLAATGAVLTAAIWTVPIAERHSVTEQSPNGEQREFLSEMAQDVDARVEVAQISGDEGGVSKVPSTSVNETPDRTPVESVGSTAAERGPWDEFLANRPLPFEDAWSRRIFPDTSILTLDDLQEWFAPVAGHPHRFLTGHGRRELPGFEGLVKLRAPFAADVTLRLSVPEHQNLRIYLYYGDAGLMIQHNDADDRAYTKMRNLEGELARARESLGEARENYKLKNNAAQGPLKAIQAAVNTVTRMKTELEKTEKRKPAVVEASRKADRVWRKATTEKNRTLREVSRLAARSRSAARKARNALAAASRKPDDKALARAVEAANQLAKKEAEASRLAARAKTDASRAWSAANSRHLAADRELKKVDQDTRRWQQQLRNAERRVNQQRARAKRCIDEREAAQRSVESAVVTVDRFENDLTLVKQEAASEAVNRPDDPNAWAIWSTQRAPESVLPGRRILRGTDEGRTHSTALRRSSQIELRYLDGNVLLTRGDVILLTAPMPRAPDEVYLSGSVLIDHLAMLRTYGSPASYKLQTDVVNESAADRLNWTSESGPVNLPTLSGGSVEVSEDTPRGLTFPIDNGQIIVLNVHASAGTEITLQNAVGEQLGSLQYFHDQASSDLAIRWNTQNASGPQLSAEATAQTLIRSVSAQHFVRLLFGCGNVKAWVGVDSTNWVPVGHPLTGLSESVSRIGLHRSNEDRSGRIALSDVQYQCLRQINLIRGNIAIPEESGLIGADVSNWRRRLLDQQPEDVSSEDWLRACAVDVLTIGCDAEVAEEIFDLLLDAAFAHEESTHTLYSLLHEFSLLTDLWTDESRLNRMVDRFKRVAEYSTSQHDNHEAFSEFCHVLMSMPLWTQHQIPIAALPLVRQELLQSVYSERWNTVQRLCQRLRFFEMLQGEPLIEWAVGLAVQLQPELASGRLPVFPEKWRHPLNHRSDKEQYNLVADFDAAVSALALDDAMRLTESIANSIEESVVRSQSDPRLFISPRTAIESARANVPSFKERIDQDLLPAALLRLRQSILKCDASGVELAAVRYPATGVAEEAYAWLGDRALSSGRFRLALKYFQQAQEAAGPQNDGEHATRIALAVAMLGGNNDLPESSPAHINGRVVEEFNSLLDEMRTREIIHADRFLQLDNGRSRLSGLGSVPRNITLAKRGHIDNLTQPDAADLLAVSCDENCVFVNSGNHITALDRRNGERIWTSSVKSTSDSRSPVLVSMRPLIAGDLLFARLHDTTGPLLVCLNKESGERKWSRQSSPNEVFVSDPMLNNGSLYSLVATRPDQGGAILRIVQVDPDNGRFIQDHTLVQLQDSWWQHKSCRVTPQPRSFIACPGGVIINTEYSGAVRWIRSQTVVPADVDASRTAQYFDPPLVDSGRMYVVQPGVPVVDCIEKIGGKLKWRVVLPTVRRLAGISHGRLIVITDHDIRSLDCNDGSVVWKRTCMRPVRWVNCSDDSAVVYCQTLAVPDSKGLHVPELIWLDQVTGQVLHRRSIDVAPDLQVVVSPIFTIDDRAWAFIGRSSDTSRLDLFEFTEVLRP